MSKYYLNAVLNDMPILTITSGKLHEIDNFIYDNNIYNVEQLYNYIKDKINFELSYDYIEFVIEYRSNGKLKTKPLFFKNELSSFKRCSNHALYIYELMMKDIKFKNKFDCKYINQLLSIEKKTPIVGSAYDYIKELNYDTFKKLYNSLVSKKKDNDLSNMTFKNAEELRSAATERKYDYNKQRDMYFFTYFWNKNMPKTKLVVSNYEKMDEFDEQMIHDQNPDTYELYGRKIVQDDEFNLSKSVKKKSKRKIYENPDQLSFFDNK